VLAVYSIQRDPPGIWEPKCQDFGADRVNGQHRNLNKRVPIPGVKAPPYYMVVPTLTYAKLRVPVPSDLPTNPPAGRPAVNAAVD